MLTYNIDREQSYQQYPEFIFLNIIVVLLVVYTFFQFQIIVQLYLTHIILISGLYAIPRILGNISRFSLRHIPWLKVFLIAYVWAIVTAELPLLILSEETEPLFYGSLFWERFVFFLAITLPFDIGDLQEDKERGVKTLVMVLGIQGVKVSSFLLILVFWAIVYFNYSIFYFWIQGLLVLSIVIVIFLIKNETSPLYYRRILDGSILFYALLTLLAIC